MQALSAYGEHLGLAFQVQDDLLDLVGSESATGKPRGSDLRAGKKTLPVLVAHARGDAATRSKLEAAVGNEKLRGPALDEAVRIIRSTGAVETCRERVAAEFQTARDALDGLAGNRGKQDLLGVLDTLQVRKA